MSINRLQARIDGVSKLGIAILRNHDLRFHKVGKDGSSKCDVYKVNNTEHFVIGVVYKINPLERPRLDKVEGLGNGYEEKQIAVDMDGNMVDAFTYYATNIDEDRKPLLWYKEHVLKGARENRFPEEYIRKIEMIESIDDHNKERHDRELAIYNK
jgi:gamma-glutamylcyclotransferase (GGCT)/AIG2-like uncharacterized protein YtfP